MTTNLNKGERSKDLLHILKGNWRLLESYYNTIRHNYHKNYMLEEQDLYIKFLPSNNNLYHNIVEKLLLLYIPKVPFAQKNIRVPF